MDLRKFKKHLRSLFSNWVRNKTELWNDARILIVCTPPKSSSIQCPKSSAFFNWLFGFNCADTLMVLTCSKIHFVCPPSKEAVLKSLEETLHYSLALKLEVHVNATRGTISASKLGEVLKNVVTKDLDLKGNKHSDDEVVVGWIEEEARQLRFPSLAEYKKWKKGKGMVVPNLVFSDLSDAFTKASRFNSNEEGRKAVEEELGSSCWDDGMVVVETVTVKAGDEGEEQERGCEKDSLEKDVEESVQEDDDWLLVERVSGGKL